MLARPKERRSRLRLEPHMTRGFTPELAKHFAELPEPNPEFQIHLDKRAEKADVCIGNGYRLY